MNKFKVIISENNIMLINTEKTILIVDTIDPILASIYLYPLVRNICPITPLIEAKSKNINDLLFGITNDLINTIPFNNVPTKNRKNKIVFGLSYLFASLKEDIPAPAIIADKIPKISP